MDGKCIFNPNTFVSRFIDILIDKTPDKTLLAAVVGNEHLPIQIQKFNIKHDNTFDFLVN